MSVDRGEVLSFPRDVQHLTPTCSDAMLCCCQCPSSCAVKSGDGNCDWDCLHPGPAPQSERACQHLFWPSVLGGQGQGIG
eukprot:3477642-Rhodomonas_salina.2